MRTCTYKNDQIGPDVQGGNRGGTNTSLVSRDDSAQNIAAGQCVSPGSLRSTRQVLFAFALLLVSAGLYGAPLEPAASLEQAQRQARQYMALPPAAAREFALGLGSAEAAALLSQVRTIARERNPDVDRLAYLIAQLESQRATELAQLRLNNLLLVILLTVGLLGAFLTYMLFAQRQALSRLAKVVPKEGPKQTAGEVYRG